MYILKSLEASEILENWPKNEEPDGELRNMLGSVLFFFE